MARKFSPRKTYYAYFSSILLSQITVFNTKSAVSTSSLTTIVLVSFYDQIEYKQTSKPTPGTRNFQKVLSIDRQASSATCGLFMVVLSWWCKHFRKYFLHFLLPPAPSIFHFIWFNSSFLILEVREPGQAHLLIDMHFLILLLPVHLVAIFFWIFHPFMAASFLPFFCPSIVDGSDAAISIPWRIFLL